MSNVLVAIITLLISAVIFIPLGVAIRKRIAESKIQSAENEAKRLLENVKIEAENTKREEIFKAKEEMLKLRNELDQEIKERRGEVAQQERRLIQKEENLDRRVQSLEDKEKDLEKKILENDNIRSELEQDKAKELEELQRISELTVEEAKKQLLDSLEEEIVPEKAAKLKEYEGQLKEESSKMAKEMVSYAIQKCAADHTSETTVFQMTI